MKPNLRTAILGAALVLMVFLPRVLDLGRFLAHDEEYVNNWNRESARAMVEGRWGDVLSSTSGAGNLTWAPTTGVILRYLRLRASGHDLTLSEAVDYGPEYDHLPGAVLCALAVLAMYPFARAAFDPTIAYVLVALLAFDPYLLAESRAIRMEGGYSVFVLLTLLALAAHARTRGRRYVVWSGIWFAWATVSKISGLGIIPLAGLVLLVTALGRNEGDIASRLKGWAFDFGVWLAVGVVGFYALWPMMWAAPAEGISRLYALVLKLAGGQKNMPFFFMGKNWDTVLPPIYYPIVVLYKTTPLAWLGLGLFACAAWRCRKSRQTEKWGGVGFPVGGALIPLAFAAFYMVVMSFGAFKQERYMICVVGSLEIAAAVGLVLGSRWARKRWEKTHAAVVPILGAVLFFGLHALPSMRTHPYYYSYYNPLLGGVRAAYRVVQVGSGEGVDLAMKYLNEKPNPEDQTVVCGTNLVRCEYASAGQHILKQETLNYTSSEWVGADYVITYLFQEQRGDYPQELLDYLETHTGVEKSVMLNGFEFATVYRAPGAKYVAASYLPGVATLLGYDADGPAARAGESVGVKLYLQSDGYAGQKIYVRLEDGGGYPRAETFALVPPGFEEAAREKGGVFEADVLLQIPPYVPPGVYYLKIGMVDPGGGEIGGFELPTVGDELAVSTAADFPQPDGVEVSHPVGESPAGAVRLLGYDLSAAEIPPGGRVWLTLYWFAEEKPPEDYEVTLLLEDESGEELVSLRGSPAYGTYPTGQWAAGQVVQDPWPIDVPQDAAPGTYTLEAGLAEAGRTVLGSVQVIDRLRSYDAPSPRQPLDVRFGDVATLVGYDLFGDVKQEQQGMVRLTLTLYWRAESETDVSYRVLTRLLDAGGNEVAARRGEPSGGDAPTDTWLPGEFVADTHVFPEVEMGDIGGYSIEVAVVDDERGVEAGARHTIEVLPDNVMVRIQP